MKITKLNDVIPAACHFLAHGTSALMEAAKTTGATVSHALSGHSSSDGSSCDGELMVMGGVAIGVVVVSASAVGGVYALKKTANSISNILHGEKVIRSGWRLGCMAGAAYLGVLTGAVIGAAIGTALPGIGTAAGAIIGAICGAAISAGIGAIIAKYTAKFVSWVFHCDSTDVISNTNPSKYRLSLRQGQSLEKTNPGLDIHKMLSALRNKKNETRLAGSMPFSKSLFKIF